MSFRYILLTSFFFITLCSVFVYKKFTKKITPTKDNFIEHLPSNRLEISNKNLLFSSLQQEVTQIPLGIQGNLPTWLHGTLFATGPAVFELGEAAIRYWFDGFAMIHKINFNNKMLYSNKMLHSNYYTRCLKEGKLPNAARSNQQSSSWFNKLSQVIKTKEIYDNANTAIFKLGNNYVASTETPTPVVFDHATLTTLRTIPLSDSIKGHVCPAAPIIDPTTGHLLTYLTEFGTQSFYHLIDIDTDGNRKKICSIPTKFPAYMRSFAATEHYIILTEIPLRVNPTDLLFSTGSFIEQFSWQPELGTQFYIIDRATRNIKTILKTDAFFMFHQVNAYEKNDKEIIIDIVTYPHHQVVDSLKLESLRNNRLLPASQLKRYILNHEIKTVSCTIIQETIAEFPTIHPEYVTKNYNYIYALTASTKENFFDTIKKINITTQQNIFWHQDGCYPSKPTFVPHPQAQHEDDGVLLSLVLDTIQEKSFVLILDAHNLQEIARAYLPHHIPLGTQLYYAQN